LVELTWLERKFFFDSDVQVPFAVIACHVVGLLKFVVSR
jgi:hypothetical protein